MPGFSKFETVGLAEANAYKRSVQRHLLVTDSERNSKIHRLKGIQYRYTAIDSVHMVTAMYICPHRLLCSEQ